MTLCYLPLITRTCKSLKPLTKSCNGTPSGIVSNSKPATAAVAATAVSLMRHRRHIFGAMKKGSQGKGGGKGIQRNLRKTAKQLAAKMGTVPTLFETMAKSDRWVKQHELKLTATSLDWSEPFMFSFSADGGVRPTNLVGIHSICEKHPCMVWYSYLPTFTIFYHEKQPNVGKYTIHGWYGFGHVISVGTR